MIETDIDADRHFILGEDKTLRFTHTGTGSIAGYELRFNIRANESDTAPNLFMADNVGQGGLVIVDPLQRIYEITIGDEITDGHEGALWKPIGGTTYYWTVKKLNSGAEVVIAKGKLIFGKSTQRKEP